MKRCLPVLILSLLAACHPARKPQVPDAVTKTVPTPEVHGDAGPTGPVNIPIDPPAAAPRIQPIDSTRDRPPNVTAILRDLTDRLQDAFFDYDRSAVRSDAMAALEADARLLAPVLSEYPQVTVILEGHCDERGSAEYNIGLGDHRARRAAEILYEWGISRERVQIVSYGKEAPQCRDPNEGCRQRNRRAHVTLRAGAPTE